MRNSSNCSSLLLLSISLSFWHTHTYTHTHSVLYSPGDEFGWFQGFWEQIIYVYCPRRARCKALLTGPEADVHFREAAVERFSGIIRGRGAAVRALWEPLTKWSHVPCDATNAWYFFLSKRCIKIHFIFDSPGLNTICFWSFCTVHIITCWVNEYITWFVLIGS